VAVIILSGQLLNNKNLYYSIIIKVLAIAI